MGAGKDESIKFRLTDRVHGSGIVPAYPEADGCARKLPIKMFINKIERGLSM